MRNDSWLTPSMGSSDPAETKNVLTCKAPFRDRNTWPMSHIDILLLWLLSIGHVRDINILAWLRGFLVKLLYLVLFSLYLSLFGELEDKRNLKNLQFWPESLGAMLEYWYIERGLLIGGPPNCPVKHVGNRSRGNKASTAVKSKCACGVAGGCRLTEWAGYPKHRSRENPHAYLQLRTILYLKKGQRCRHDSMLLPLFGQPCVNKH